MKDDGKLHPSETFGKLFEPLLHNLSITDGACRLYAHMHWRYGANQDNHESLGSMATFMGVSEATISKRILELESNDWVVVVGRDYNPKTGMYQTPFYHVFENQEQCREFRKNFVALEMEFLRPKTEARVRKSRAGIGGNPNKVKTPLNSSYLANSSLPGLANSSLTNLDSGDLDSIKEKEPAPKSSAELLGKPIAELTTSIRDAIPPQPAPKRKERKRPIRELLGKDYVHWDNVAQGRYFRLTWSQREQFIAMCHRVATGEKWKHLNLETPLKEPADLQSIENYYEREMLRMFPGQEVPRMSQPETLHKWVTEWQRWHNETQRVIRFGEKPPSQYRSVLDGLEFVS